jgi:hypothetical protein
MDRFTKLTEEETRVAQPILNEFDNLGVMRCLFDDIPVAVIVTIAGEGEDVLMRPVAIIVTESIMDRLSPPEGVHDIPRGPIQ